MATYQIEMIVKYIRGDWLVNVYQFTREEDPKVPGKFIKPKVARVGETRLKAARLDHCWADVVVRAALGLVFEEELHPPTPPASPPPGGGPVKSSRSLGATISEAPPRHVKSASEASTVVGSDIPGQQELPFDEGD